MTKQETTAIFIFLMMFAIGSYDIFAEVVWGEPATISAVVRGWAAHFPLLKPLILSGMITLFWHLFLK